MSNSKFKFKKVSEMKPFVVYDIVNDQEKLTVDQFVELNQPALPSEEPPVICKQTNDNIIETKNNKTKTDNNRKKTLKGKLDSIEDVPNKKRKLEQQEIYENVERMDEFLVNNIDWNSDVSEDDIKDFQDSFRYDKYKNDSLCQMGSSSSKKNNLTALNTQEEFNKNNVNALNTQKEVNKNVVASSSQEEEDYYEMLAEAQSKQKSNDFDDFCNMPSTSANESFNYSMDFSNSRKDDTREFQGVYPFTEVMKEVLVGKFGLKDYRPGQQEIINATLEQHDVFVLMPTGGGKSLCYQLPAILTPGVTIVISPLRALIGDQCDKLNALDIPAAHLCADVKDSDKNAIFAKLSTKEPSLKLLYLTPEKIVASPSTCAMIKALYDRKKLARFVIDEVHCMSQWGHDFRPDYKKMSDLRVKYPGVPIICLTATATKLVQEDVLSILKLRDVKKFITSFNRPNIKYIVLPKDSKTVNQEIAALIRKNFPKKSGIIYCLCRKDCEKVAEVMCSLGVSARPYHAGMTSLQRERQQRDWMNNVFYVVVATIAFGMGIDKPDVRFVIHNSLPKTIEAFYQESGRAGRDGEDSYSYLFYNYSDAARLKKLIQMDRTASKKTIEGHFASVDQMALFAENKVECRRYLVLAHLGEKFDRQECINNKTTTCDNCINMGNCSTKDVTKEALEIAKLVKDLCQNNQLTMHHIVEVYRGATNKKITESQHSKHPLYGKGANLSKSNIERVIRSLMTKQFIVEYSVRAGHFPIVYIKAGPKLNLESTEKFTLTISTLTEKQLSVEPSTSNGIEPWSSNGIEPSTNEIRKIKDDCQESLLAICHKYATEKNVTISSIMNLTAVKYMAQILPANEEEFMNIQYVTRANFEKYGKAFLEVTKKFRAKIDALKKAPAVPSFKFAVDPSFNKDDWKTNMPKSTGRAKGTYRGRKGTRRKRTYRRKTSKKSPKKAKSKFPKLPLMHVS